MQNLVEFSEFQSKIEKYDCKASKLEFFFNKMDSRVWAAIVNQNKENVFVVHHINKYDLGDSSFDVLSSEKTLTDVDPEDIYQTVELLLR